MAFYNTFVNYNGNGSTTDFSVPFSYLDQNEVIVTFAGSGSYTYTFVSQRHQGLPCSGGGGICSH